MKIDSSYIGMESARRYTSVERKTVGMTVVNATTMQGSEMENRSFADLFQKETGEEETEPYMDGLAKVTGLMQTGSARSITSLEEKRTMQSIRQQCLQYLIRLQVERCTGRRYLPAASYLRATGCHKTGQSDSVLLSRRNRGNCLPHNRNSPHGRRQRDQLWAGAWHEQKIPGRDED